MKIDIDPAIALKLGHLQLSECAIGPSPDALLKLFEETANAARARHAEMPVGEHRVASGVRRLFKSVGIDPSRYRPSGEALVRRIMKDQGLYHINAIVDINNICSMESLFPLGAYVRSRIQGDVTIRLGRNDEL